MTAPHSGGGIARSAPPGKFTRTTAARMIGVSLGTLRHWEKEGALSPSGGRKQHGDISVRLYTAADVARGLQLKSLDGPIRDRIEALKKLELAQNFNM